MIRQATMVLFAAAILAPAAGAGRYSIAAPPPSVASASLAPTTCHQYCGARHHAQTARTRSVIVHDLVSASNGGFHWLDAAIGFGFAAISVAAVLLVISVVGGRRTRVRPANSAS